MTYDPERWLRQVARSGESRPEQIRGAMDRARIGAATWEDQIALADEIDRLRAEIVPGKADA